MIEKNKKLYVHFGPHKTGTTAIQKVLSQCEFANLLDRNEVQKLLLAPTRETYDIDAFESYLDEKTCEKKINVISDEEFSGNVHCGGNGGLTFYETVNRLRKLTNYKIVPIYVCRIGHEACYSCWKQYVKKGGKRSYKWYLSQDPKRLTFRFPKFDKQHYIYRTKIECLWEAFGENDVKVLEYSHNIVQDFCDSINLPISRTNIPLENKSDAIKDYTIARYLNFIVSEDEVCEPPLIVSRKISSVLRKLNKIKILDDQADSKIIELNAFYEADWNWVCRNVF